jgi:hypothetical protein
MGADAGGKTAAAALSATEESTVAGKPAPIVIDTLAQMCDRASNDQKKSRPSPPPRLAPKLGTWWSVWEGST